MAALPYEEKAHQITAANGGKPPRLSSNVGVEYLMDLQISSEAESWFRSTTSHLWQTLVVVNVILLLWRKRGMRWSGVVALVAVFAMFESVDVAIHDLAGAEGMVIEPWFFPPAFAYGSILFFIATVWKARSYHYLVRTAEATGVLVVFFAVFQIYHAGYGYLPFTLISTILPLYLWLLLISTGHDTVVMIREGLKLKPQPTATDKDHQSHENGV